MEGSDPQMRSREGDADEAFQNTKGLRSHEREKRFHLTSRREDGFGGRGRQVASRFVASAAQTVTQEHPVPGGALSW